MSRVSEVEIQKAADELVGKSASLTREVEVSFGKIESMAAVLISKSAESLSPDQAIAKVLRTPRGQEAYGQYTRAQDRVRSAVLSEDMLGGRDRIARDLLETVTKAIENGEDADAVAEDELSRPGVAAALGLARVEKSGDDAWAEIEKAADAVVAKSDGVSRSAAIGRVLKSDEGKRLYAQYLDENPAQVLYGA